MSGPSYRPLAAVSPRAVARIVGGRVHGNKVIAPGPGHSARDRSLSIIVSPDVPDGFLVHSFAGDDDLEIKRHIRQELGLGPSATRNWVTPTPPDHSNRDRAMAIWREAVDPKDTPVEVYLASRGLPLGKALRWHPNCPFASARTGAMVALITDVITNEPQAIHRTALTAAGAKAEVEGYSRLTLGSSTGGVIRLWADDAVTLAVGIGEGIETTLSINLVDDFQGLPVWSAISATGVATFPLLSGIETLVVAVDHDRAGVSAAQQVRDVWTEADREVITLLPRRSGADLNEIVLEVAVDR